jgi:hypothetical protein
VVYASRRPERANVGSDKREVEGRSVSDGRRGSKVVGWKKRREGVGCDIACSLGGVILKRQTHHYDSFTGYAKSSLLSIPYIHPLDHLPSPQTEHSQTIARRPFPQASDKQQHQRAICRYSSNQFGAHHLLGPSFDFGFTYTAGVDEGRYR